MKQYQDMLNNLSNSPVVNQTQKNVRDAALDLMCTKIRESGYSIRYVPGFGFKVKEIVHTIRLKV